MAHFSDQFQILYDSEKEVLRLSILIHENLVTSYYIGLAEFKMMVDSAKSHVNFRGGVVSVKIHPTQVILLFQDSAIKQSVFQLSIKEFQKLLSKFNRAANSLRLNQIIPSVESLHLENHTEVGAYLLNHLQPVLSSLSQNLSLQTKDLEEIKNIIKNLSLHVENISTKLALVETRLQEKLENITISPPVPRSSITPLLSNTPIFIPSKINIELAGTVKTQTEQVENTSINAASLALKKLKKEKK